MITIIMMYLSFQNFNKFIMETGAVYGQYMNILISLIYRFLAAQCVVESVILVYLKTGMYKLNEP